MNGYAHPDYAQSFLEFGTPKKLENSEGWILERQIPEVSYKDAMGCYPIFSCKNWAGLKRDIENLPDDYVSLSLVLDPFGEYGVTDLRDCFKDKVIPFKEHYIVDLSKPVDKIVSSHHRYYARKALKTLKVEVHAAPENFLEEWISLFKYLTDKHNINGIKAFSRQAFAEQLKIPGIVVIRALYEGQTVGAKLAFIQGDVLYGHVLAFNESGYKLGAAYALYWYAIEYFRNKIRWYDIGAVPGMNDGKTHGLAQFKKGWATDTRMAYFCGKILNREKYIELISKKSTARTDYFPAYRQGEFI